MRTRRAAICVASVVLTISAAACSKEVSGTSAAPSGTTSTVANGAAGTTTPVSSAPDPKDPASYASASGTPKLSQPANCVGVAGVCLGAPLEAVTSYMGVEDERFASDPYVGRTWQKPWGALTVLTDHVNAIKSVQLSLEGRNTAQAASYGGFTIGVTPLGDIAAAWGGTIGGTERSVGATTELGSDGLGGAEPVSIFYEHVDPLATAELDYPKLVTKAISFSRLNAPPVTTAPPSTAAPTTKPPATLYAWKSPVKLICGEAGCKSNIRELPSTDASVLRQVPDGADVDIFCQVPAGIPWFGVIGGGYIRSDLVAGKYVLDSALNLAPLCAPA